VACLKFLIIRVANALFQFDNPVLGFEGLYYVIRFYWATEINIKWRGDPTKYQHCDWVGWCFYLFIEECGWCTGYKYCNNWYVSFRMFCVDTDDTKALYDWGWTNGQMSEIHQGCNNMRIIINKAEINLKQIEHEHVL